MSGVAVVALILSSHLRPVAREAYLMGTRATLVTYDASRPRALARLERLLDALEDTEAELSTWRPDSLMSRLNRQPPGVPLALSRAACDEMAQVFRWHQATRGAFDPTVGRLMAVWGLQRAGRLPAADALAGAYRLTGLGALDLDDRTCELVRARVVEVDTGGFGKGAALDRAAAAVSDSGRWLIDLGGQVAVRGSPPGLAGWSVRLAHPVRRDEPLLELSLAYGSLATSGGSERDRLVDGVRVGHILDPRTGRPASFAGSVTVWHPSGLVADILSTALFVMGPADGLAWAEAHDLAACYLERGREEPDVIDVRMTRAFERRFPRRRWLRSPAAPVPHLAGGLPISR